jgi:hypothetical protein
VFKRLLLCAVVSERFNVFEMEDDEEAAKKQSVVDLEELYVWLQQFEDPTIGKVIYGMYRMLSDQLASQFPHPFPRDSAQY